MTDQKLTVRKSNTLVDSRHQLSTHQQRAFMLFVSKIKPRDKPDKTYSLKWSDLHEISHGKIDTRAKITELFESMRAKKINLSTEGVDRAASYFSFYENDHKAQVVRVRVDQSIQQELFDLIGQFTLYSLECALNLDSPYYIRLYEILKARAYKAQHGPVDIELDNLKWSLGCDDVKTYNQWANFKRYVLDKAMVALGKHTDLKFKYKTVKAGRKVTGIRFTIEENKTWQSTIMSLEKKNKPGPKSKPRLFVREGDAVLMDGNEYEVGPSGIEHKGKTFAIGQLTTGIKAGKISLVKEGEKG
jgi:plasmid replication initiation protein